MSRVPINTSARQDPRFSFAAERALEIVTAMKGVCGGKPLALWAQPSRAPAAFSHQGQLFRFSHISCVTPVCMSVPSTKAPTTPNARTGTLPWRPTWDNDTGLVWCRKRGQAGFTEREEHRARTQSMCHVQIGAAAAKLVTGR